MLDRVTLADFSATIDQTYALDLPDGSGLELVLEAARASGDPRPFSVVFRGPPAPELAQGIYPLTHPAFPGPLAIFLVPIARDEAGMRYEAVFG